MPEISLYGVTVALVIVKDDDKLLLRCQVLPDKVHRSGVFSGVGLGIIRAGRLDMLAEKRTARVLCGVAGPSPVHQVVGKLDNGWL